MSAPKLVHILLRSSWQMVNIGDIAHTPGVLALIEKHIPEARVTLWASQGHSIEVAEMERRRFPSLKIVKGNVDEEGRTQDPDLREAIASCDFILHGSGPAMLAHKDVAAVHKATGKPFGVYGITYGGFGTDERQVLDKARFIFFRDSVSLKRAKDEGIQSPVMEFGPDGAFAVDLRAEAAADSYLRAQGLEPGRFLVVIPRLRYTPYWKIFNRTMTDEERKRWEKSQSMKDSDHAKMIEAISAFVRTTGMKVLVCPEDSSHMEIGLESVVKKLPADVREQTVWRETFWLTDEAVSVYERAFALLSLDMHSPIMALGRGVPAMVCRFSEQTSKGFMWRDIGLGSWLFDLDEEKDGSRIKTALLGIAADPKGARKQAAKAMALVEKRQKETMAVLRGELGLQP